MIYSPVQFLRQWYIFQIIDKTFSEISFEIHTKKSLWYKRRRRIDKLIRVHLANAGLINPFHYLDRYPPSLTLFIFPSFSRGHEKGCSHVRRGTKGVSSPYLLPSLPPSPN